MTRFVDGPAAGVTLMLRRAPMLLRAVRAADGTWDALDQLEDTPRADETVVVYRMARGPFAMHVNRDRRHGGCAWYRGGEYVALDPQPPTTTVRDTETWRAWAQEIAPTLPAPATAQ
jgi:hypothetical protein